MVSWLYIPSCLTNTRLLKTHILLLLGPVTQLGPDLTCEATRALVFAKFTRGIVSLMLLVIPVHWCVAPVFLLSRWQWNLWQTKFYCCDLEAVEAGHFWEWEEGKHLLWPPSLGGNFPSQLQTWQKAADCSSENALIVARLQNFFKMNYITKPYKYSSSSNLPDLAWLVVLNNLVALIKSLWVFVVGAFVYEVICWIPDEFKSDKTC